MVKSISKTPPNSLEKRERIGIFNNFSYQITSGYRLNAEKGQIREIPVSFSRYLHPILQNRKPLPEL